MTWLHSELFKTGLIPIIENRQNFEARYAIGAYYTGKQRVFKSYLIRVDLADGSEVTGEDRHNLRQALFDVAKKLTEMGITLSVAGLDERFYESGLSHNSGWGYIDGLGRIHMMSSASLLGGSKKLSLTIDEATTEVEHLPVIPDEKS